MSQLGTYATIIIVGLIVLFGLIRKVEVFNVFLEGASDNLKVLLNLIPSLIGLITAVEMLKASGALDAATALLTPIAELLRIPAGTLPLCLLKPVSGGGTIAILNEILDTYGPDSLTGRIASVMCGSSETTFYTVTVYFGAVGIKKTRHTISVALVADFVAIIVSSLTIKLMFG